MDSTLSNNDPTDIAQDDSAMMSRRVVPPLIQHNDSKKVFVSRGLRRQQTVKQIMNPLMAQSAYSKMQHRLRQFISWEQAEAPGAVPLPTARRTPERFRIRSIDHDTAWFEHASDHLVVAFLTNYFKWTFRSSFVLVMLSACLLYVLWIFLFAIVIYNVMRHSPECIAGSETFVFLDAYHLSWTTLSTVGYGVIGPAVGQPSRCVGINVIMAYESFFGVLYASLVGAIVFSKIARIQSVAAVRFSRVICVRYGSGLKESETGETDDDEEQSGDGEKDSPMIEPTPCPYLEFRLINDLSHSKGGEIIDATIRVVACVVDEDDEHDSRLKGKQNSKKRTAMQKLKAAQVAQAAAASLVGAGRLAGAAAGKTLVGARKIAESTTGNLIQQVNWAILHQTRDPMMMDPISVPENVDAVEAQQELEKQLKGQGSVALADATRTVVPVNEGNSKLLPPRKYHKLRIETDQHPCFNRSWIIRHVLDETSPLLSVAARRRIAEHQGMWPFETYQEVREHLKFTQMIVTFSGTANVSGTSVYAQTVYDYDCVFVGYAFANLLTIQKGHWVVDAELIDDIREQKGGGAEPIEGDANVVTFRNVPTDEIIMTTEGEVEVNKPQMKSIPEDTTAVPHEEISGVPLQDTNKTMISGNQTAIERQDMLSDVTAVEEHMGGNDTFDGSKE